MSANEVGGANSTIHRYRLDLAAEQIVSLPLRAQILTVQRRDGTDDALDLWAAVNPNQAERENVPIRLVGTGSSEALGRYLSTVQLDGGRLVLHVFVQGWRPR